MCGVGELGCLADPVLTRQMKTTTMNRRSFGTHYIPHDAEHRQREDEREPSQTPASDGPGSERVEDCRKLKRS